MTELWLLAALAVAAVLWYHNRAAAERAYAAAAAACEQLRLQLLDDSVSLTRLSLARRDDGRWALRREYRFEFCTARTERRQGLVALLGGTLEYVHLGTPQQSLIVQPGITDGDGGNAGESHGPTVTERPVTEQAADKPATGGGRVIAFPQRRPPH